MQPEHFVLVNNEYVGSIIVETDTWAVSVSLITKVVNRAHSHRSFNVRLCTARSDLYNVTSTGRILWNITYSTPMGRTHLDIHRVAPATTLVSEHMKGIAMQLTFQQALLKAMLQIWGPRTLDLRSFTPRYECREI